VTAELILLPHQKRIVKKTHIWVHAIFITSNCTQQMMPLIWRGLRSFTLRGIAIHYLSGGVHKFHLPEFVHIVLAAARGEKSGTGNQIWRRASEQTSLLRPLPSDKNCNIAACAHGAVCP
jgi:hypothetical protein